MNKLYRKKIDEFVDKLNQEFSKDQLKLLYINLPKLKIKRKYFMSNFGTYNTKRNTITLCKTTSATFFHEMLHMASGNSKKIAAGFCKVLPKQMKYVGIGLNEGYTELLNRRLFGEKYKDEYEKEKSYVINIMVASIIEEAIGVEEMTSLYLKADLAGLVSKISDKINSNVIDAYTFIEDLDYLLTMKGMYENYNYRMYRSLITLVSLIINNSLKNNELSPEEKYEKAMFQINQLLLVVDERFFMKDFDKIISNINNISTYDILKMQYPISDDSFNLYNKTQRDIGIIYIHLLNKTNEELENEYDYEQRLIKLYEYNFMLQELFGKNIDDNLASCNKFWNLKYNTGSKKL